MPCVLQQHHMPLLLCYQRVSQWEPWTLLWSNLLLGWKANVLGSWGLLNKSHGILEAMESSFASGLSWAHPLTHYQLSYMPGDSPGQRHVCRMYVWPILVNTLLYLLLSCPHLNLLTRMTLRDCIPAPWPIQIQIFNFIKLHELKLVH